MTRLAVSAALLLSALATTARAQEETSGPGVVNSRGVEVPAGPDTPAQPDPQISDALACLNTSEGVLCTEQPQLLTDLESAAAEANVSALDVLNALTTLHAAGIDVTAREYLFGKPKPVAHGYTARVRLTYYNEAGVTYSGGRTYPGSTACSWNFAIGSRFALPNGEVVTCNDRGLLGSSGWLDVFRRPDLAAKYGPYATVQVIS